MLRKNKIVIMDEATANIDIVTEQKIEKLAKWNFSRYQITLDGPPEIHDKRRPTRGGGSTFEDIVGNIERAVSRLPICVPRSGVQSTRASRSSSDDGGAGISACPKPAPIYPAPIWGVANDRVAVPPAISIPESVRKNTGDALT